MSDSIHDEDDLPTLEEVQSAGCTYLIEPDDKLWYRWQLNQMGETDLDRGFECGTSATFESAQTAVREAFKRLRDQDTAIISIAERREMHT